MKWLVLLCMLMSVSLSGEGIKVYLCARLSKEARAWNDEVSKCLGEGFEIFRPQDIELGGLEGGELDLAAYTADLQGMRSADVLLVLPPYGRDCAWEMGWFCGKGKRAIAYVENDQGWLRDAMVKGGLFFVITSGSSTYEKLKEDPALKGKCQLIEGRRELGRAIKGLCEKQEE